MTDASKKKILIVEDEQLVSYLMEHYVTETGLYKVVGSVDNSVEAMNIAMSEKPDLILMDIRIEGDKDGIDTALEINKYLAIPIVFTSGNTDEKTLERAKKTNMLGFLQKPVDKNSLVELLARKFDFSTQ